MKPLGGASLEEDWVCPSLQRLGSWRRRSVRYRFSKVKRWCQGYEGGKGATHGALRDCHMIA